MGPLVDGLSLWLVAGLALIGALVGAVISCFAVRPWRDPQHGPTLGAAILLLAAVPVVIVAAVSH